MKESMLFVYIFLYFTNFHVCNATTGDLTLELVQVVFRHGARTPGPSEALRLNVTNPAIYWPQGFYQLTNEGKQQAYSLGSLLRKKYDKFLGPYNPREYHALTTAITRTVMSLQLALAGLFPPAPEDSWNSKLHWRPVPFHQNPSDLDILLAPHQTRKFNALCFEETDNSSEYQRKLSNYMEFLELMEKKTGMPFKGRFLFYIGWTYYSVKYHKDKGLPLPNWYTDDSIFANLTELFRLGLDGLGWTTQLKRLYGGILVRQFIENINDNRNAATRKKIYMYATHDLTLDGFSKAQKFEAFYLPPFGSALIMEKYTDSQNSEYIRMLAWSPADGEKIRTVRIGNCDELCSFEDYLEIVKDYTATDEDIEYLSGDTNVEDFLGANYIKLLISK